MNKPGVMIYFDMRPSRRLPDADRLRLYDAMLDYAETGAEPDFGDGPLAMLWDYFQPKLDTDNERYERIRAKRSQAGRLGGLASRHTKQEEQMLTEEAPEAIPTQPNAAQPNANQREEKEKGGTEPPVCKKRFVPPKAEEVAAYAKEAGLTLEPEEFVDYYASNGWQVGKHTMKDWRAAARNWARRGLGQKAPRAAPIVLAPLEDPYDPVY